MKPVLGRFWDLNDNKYGDKLYKYLTDIFSDYVGEPHLFRYADFGLVDEAGGFWQVGEQHPTLIVAAEKQGHWKMLQAIAAETGVTVISLGGQPSLMTTEALINQLMTKGVDLDGMPAIVEAVRAYATVGEICHALRGVFGQYRGVVRF